MPVKALQVEHRVDADAVRVGPVAAPTITIGRPMCSPANASISSSVMYSMSKASSLSEA